jgi:hypothetical protein
VPGPTGPTGPTGATGPAGSDADATAEASRATAAENTLTTNLAAEVTRATTAEATKATTTALTAETSRATTAEGTNATAISSEATTARAAEATLTTAVNARALTTALTTETSRATTAEGVLTTAVAAADRGLRLKPTGVIASTVPRSTPLVNATNSSGTLRGTLIDLPSGLLISGIAFCTLSTALTNQTNQWFALLDSSYNLLRQTVNDTTTAWPINTRKALALTSTFTTTYAGFYYLCEVVTNSPSAAYGMAVSQSTLGVISEPPILGIVGDTGLTTTCPPTVTVGGSATYMQYAEVY